MYQFPFTARFNDRFEYMCVHVPMNWKYIKNPIGTWLIELLNADIENLESIVASYQLDESGRNKLLLDGFYPIQDYFPANAEELYHEIISRFSFMRAYDVQEWEAIYCQIIPDRYNRRCIRNVLDEAKEILDSFIDNPKYYDYAFLSRFLTSIVIDSNVDFTVSSGSRGHSPFQEEFEEMAHASIADCLDIAYTIFQNSKAQQATDYFYQSLSPRLEGIVYSSILELSRNDKVIRKCKNCGKYFVPENRSDTLYCDNASPQNNTMTCKQYGSQRLWYIRQKDDELATLSRNILSSKSMLSKRYPDIWEYTQSYNYFREERKIWKKAVADGTKTRDEYKEWLLYMQSQKRIKEACNGID